MEVREIIAVNRFNLLVKTFKQAYPNLTHEKAQKQSRSIMTRLKINRCGKTSSGENN